mgnify:CR=1 FL=1
MENNTGGIQNTNETRKGFTLIELIAVLGILSILMAVAVPSALGYIKSARRMAAYTDAQITADAVQQYLDEQREEGKLTIGDLHKLMNLDLGDPGNELAEYMSAGKKGALLVSVDADVKTGQLEKLIYQDKWVKVRLTVEADGTRKVEEYE